MSRKSQRNKPAEQAGVAVPADTSKSFARRWMFGLAVIAAILVGVAVIASRSEQGSSGAGAGTSGLAADALASTHSPTLGEATAKVHIVEFLDPACETCAAFYPIVKQMLADHAGKIRLSIRHLPLHEGSEVAVRALEASRAQDKYWETLESLFATQSQWTVHHKVDPQQVMRVLAATGLDMERLQADMNSPAVNERVAKDMADGKALKVTATPEYFVNGKPMPSFGEQQLRGLVAGALDEAY